MPRLILSGDSVLIKIAIKKKLIDLPGESLNVQVDGNEDMVVCGFSKRAKEVFPEMEIGSKIVLDPGTKLEWVVNAFIGEPNPATDKNAPYAYYVVKVFNITAVIVE